MPLVQAVCYAQMWLLGGWTSLMCSVRFNLTPLRCSPVLLLLSALVEVTPQFACCAIIKT